MRLASTLNERREDAALYKHLATLVEDVPMSETLDDLRWQGADRGRFQDLERRLGTLPMRPRVWQ